jgi:hypothetical protein
MNRQWTDAYRCFELARYTLPQTFTLDDAVELVEAGLNTYAAKVCVMFHDCVPR